MIRSDENLRAMAQLEHQYRHREAPSIADSLLQGWAFTGQSRQDHDTEKARLIKFIEFARRARLEKELDNGKRKRH